MLCKPYQNSDGNHKSVVWTVYAVPFWILRIHCSTVCTDEMCSLEFMADDSVQKKNTAALTIQQLPCFLLFQVFIYHGVLELRNGWLSVHCRPRSREGASYSRTLVAWSVMLTRRYVCA